VKQQSLTHSIVVGSSDIEIVFFYTASMGYGYRTLYNFFFIEIK